MTGLWVVGFVALWVVVIVLAGLLLGAMRELAVMRVRASGEQLHGPRPLPTAEETGPPVGSAPLEFLAPSINEYGEASSGALAGPGRALLVFMSPTCVGCQDAVDPLNELLERQESGLRAVIVMRGDEHASRAFVRVFPMRAPIICDEDHALTKLYGVSINPFSLLYEDGVLRGKVTTASEENFRTLLGQSSTDEESPDRTYPPARVSTPV